MSDNTGGALASGVGSKEANTIAIVGGALAGGIVGAAMQYKLGATKGYASVEVNAVDFADKKFDEEHINSMFFYALGNFPDKPRK